MSGVIRGVIVKLAERCNLNCSYCYMYNHADRRYQSRPAFMSLEVFRAIIQRVRAYYRWGHTHTMAIVFHGGEPMLFDPHELDRWLTEAEIALDGRIKWLVQTNGTLVTDAWIDVLVSHAVTVGVSLDGTPAVHNMVRLDHAGRGSYDRVVRGLGRLVEAGLDPGILCVVNPLCSGLDVYRHLTALGVRRMDLLLPDVSHDRKHLAYPDAGATPVADFLIPVFDKWFQDDRSEIQIRLFTDMIRFLRESHPRIDALGTRSQDYLVIDTDGSMLADDALKVCYDGAAESGLNVLQHTFRDLKRGAPLLSQLIHQGVPLCAQCMACPERHICGGDAVPHRYSQLNGFMNPSVWCADLLKLIRHVRAATTGSDEPAVFQQMSGHDAC